MSTRTPDSPVLDRAPPGPGGQTTFDVAATLRRIEAVLATLEGARIEAEKAPAPVLPQKRITFDWG